MKRQALLATAMLIAASAAAEKPMINPFYAMDTCTKTGYPSSVTTPEQQLDMVKDLGYKGIAWTLGDAAEMREVAAAAKQRGVKVFALYSGATLHKDRLEYDPRLAEAMAAFKGQGTLMWVHVGSPDFARSSADGDEAAATGLREIADMAAKEGLRVALYPHVGDWTERVRDCVRVVKKAGRENLGVTFNLCHCLMAGDEARIPDILAEAAPYLFMVTVNGADSGAAGTSWDRLIQTLDRGTFDLAPLLRKLRELHYAGPIGLQGYGLKGDPRENLTRSMEGWRKALARS